ncbi:MAG: bifunctional adenosylcobinamide kinase/adenosylcobinamide-phosphate guanylyltransferase [Ktedonobacteraceae bacterium]
MSPSIDASTSPKLVLVLGGARSGKSAFAEQLAASSERRVAFIATATAGDDDMRARIARHRASRPPEWLTIEEPLQLAGAVRRAAELADVLLLDCITLWLANWIGQQGDLEPDDAPGEAYTDRVLSDIEELLATLAALGPGKTLIAVSNEVGLGIVPAYPLGRVYRDTLGWVNQRLARSADRVYLMVAGLAVDIKRLQEESSFLP